MGRAKQKDVKAQGVAGSTRFPPLPDSPPADGVRTTDGESTSPRKRLPGRDAAGAGVGAEPAVAAPKLPTLGGGAETRSGGPGGNSSQHGPAGGARNAKGVVASLQAPAQERRTDNLDSRRDGDGSPGCRVPPPLETRSGQARFTDAELRVLRHVEDLRRRQHQYLMSIVQEERLAEREREKQVRSIKRKEHRRAAEKRHARARKKAEKRIMRIAQDNELVVSRKLAEAGFAGMAASQWE